MNNFNVLVHDGDDKMNIMISDEMTNTRRLPTASFVKILHCVTSKGKSKENVSNLSADKRAHNDRVANSKDKDL